MSGEAFKGRLASCVTVFSLKQLCIAVEKHYY